MKYQLKDSSSPRQVIKEGKICRTELNSPPVLVWQNKFYWRSCASNDKMLVYYQGGGEFLSNLEVANYEPQ